MRVGIRLKNKIVLNSKNKILILLNNYRFILLVILFFLISSCSVKHYYDEIHDRYSFISKVELFENELLNYSKGSDTILVVINKRVLRNCSYSNFLVLNDSSIKRIDQLKDNDRIFNFYYKMKSINNDLEVLVYNFSPIDTLKTEKIYSYKSLPFLIENCKQFK